MTILCYKSNARKLFTTNPSTMENMEIFTHQNMYMHPNYWSVKSRGIITLHFWLFRAHLSFQARIAREVVLSPGPTLKQ